ncbi:hypothetical protein [Aeromicrobium chenweiae]|uniref:Uncharacterized protein n=1 Tax=Aeromicrobium chenweiae TaxID=2079793 RepID=A0A2S0WN31_9ACTN|nr:hypothetical protein [Aeromicrobium chenweiae]AWB92716.1 hypothetical protein C3E78_11160 [Aeromicrobium chenweiae]TGN33707.1 hypothetical protein E4L97_01210 [Aeromicrobium chenweiae]
MSSFTVRTALVVLVLAVSACSGSDDDRSDAPTATATATTSVTAAAPTPSRSSKPPSVAPVDIPPCDSLAVPVPKGQKGAGTPLDAIRSWGATSPENAPPVPNDGWERLPADNKSLATMTNPTAPVWMVEVSRARSGGWAVTRASWGLCH